MCGWHVFCTATVAAVWRMVISSMCKCMLCLVSPRWCTLIVCIHIHVYTSVICCCWQAWHVTLTKLLLLAGMARDLDKAASFAAAAKL
jgi:hypothetical protein